VADIVKRLRSFDVFNAPMDIDGIMVSPVALMAADEIVRLREERDTARAQAANADAQCERDAERAERLRNALREIVEGGPQIPLDEEGEGPNWPMHIYAMKWASFSTELQNIARAALKENDQ
jgi:hypothetical protein